MPVFVNEVITEIEPVREAPPEVPPLPTPPAEQELLARLALAEERSTRLAVD